ncbi:NADP-dependent oxidoreductase [Mycobacterium sp. CBMA293]|uniref:NADP-dependent oxidoreductase n=1 Tax=unclassified Mycolicibacterium TaxID=2636767 RepID=UPI0012DCF85F|nr:MULTISPECIES: NADP-dependent oxidoreductase [unclassified Mycolicibacterium]MUL48241.1 NADP-dependent oxidoreductase [Mycolicibacterium sp. CBMA 360]MUL57591.1 NADP-dependent oxidoreductase [Mycolicibacterium sp. CBMA 335]MUL70631.1 NADP-dependent oxidoreductase [Mycolicibacterium sp. CBMA 311]MUL92679.1 NADP-dependent oxidoreductase [Mycolicibacterium sp. CBMA 230]MUM08308.1 NADP-dependent oxidoreductase [Mycolicibacterium sp. CBMA 213]
MASTLQYVLARRPQGHVTEDDFRLVEMPLPPLRDGDVQFETLCVSIDPAIRGWLDDRPSYLPPVEIGAPVRALGIARVTASRHPDFSPGDLARGFVGWQERFVVASPGSGWQRITTSGAEPLQRWLGILGMTGLTAWAGVRDILKPAAGQTVLVSGASGAVGSVAVQLAKDAGSRVVAVAGGAEKCRMLLEDLGVDAVVDRKAAGWLEQLIEATPDGVDRVFENSGGPIFEAVIERLNNHARIALCGLIDGYNLDQRPAGPTNFGLLLTKRVLTQGFIVLDYLNRAAEAQSELSGMLRNGSLKEVENLVRGFHELPRAFVQSFSSKAAGKLVVELVPV